MADYAHNRWKGRTGGTRWMQRALVGMFRYVPLCVLYAVMALVVPFYMLFSHKGYVASYDFFRRRIGYGRFKSFISVYRNHFVFGQVILDRFAMYAGRKFDLEFEGEDVFRSYLDRPGGFVMLTSHTGNNELAGYTLQPGTKIFHALVFSGETETVMAGREELFGRNNIEMVPVSDDMSHIFRLNAALSDGDIVSMPGDRIFGSTKSLVCRFLGEDAHFPQGPFSLAVQKGVPVLTLSVMKLSLRKYRVMVRSIWTGEECAGDRRAAVQELADRYAAVLAETVRAYPLQWFNYYDFWKR